MEGFGGGVHVTRVEGAFSVVHHVPSDIPKYIPSNNPGVNPWICTTHESRYVAPVAPVTCMVTSSVMSIGTFERFDYRLVLHNSQCALCSSIYEYYLVLFFPLTRGYIVKMLWVKLSEHTARHNLPL